MAQAAVVSAVASRLPVCVRRVCGVRVVLIVRSSSVGGVDYLNTTPRINNDIVTLFGIYYIRILPRIHRYQSVSLETLFIDSNSLFVFR